MGVSFVEKEDQLDRVQYCQPKLKYVIPEITFKHNIYE